MVPVKPTAFGGIAEFGYSYRARHTLRRCDVKKIILKVLFFLVTAMATAAMAGGFPGSLGGL
jgi:hypothetical protein